jgi:hypothetical protein
MPLSAGAKLGTYEVLSAIGAGGMGEQMEDMQKLYHSRASINQSMHQFTMRLSGYRSVGNL